MRAESPHDTHLSEEDTAAAETEEAPRQGLCVKLEKGGEFIIELYPEQAPIAVARITELVEQGFYDGLEFHRIESFLVQTGKRDHEMPPVEGEMFAQKLWHEEGMVGMARLPNDYDTATTQFYMMKERRSGLNGEYTLFGRVIEGMEAVHQIKKGHKIESITLCEL
jgi:cyclophilin family peptidyl-prolyl cis-trans isomerase